MRILYSEPKPEAKEFLKSLYGICFLILGIMIILAYRCKRIYWGMHRELKAGRLHAQPESYDYNLNGGVEVSGEKDTAFNHLLYFIQYQRTGHIEQANEQIRKAELDIYKEQ